eukprot:3754886-Prymnesium_polylepis.1
MSGRPRHSGAPQSGAPTRRQCKVGGRQRCGGALAPRQRRGALEHSELDVRGEAVVREAETSLEQLED